MTCHGVAEYVVTNGHVVLDEGQVSIENEAIVTCFQIQIIFKDYKEMKIFINCFYQINEKYWLKDIDKLVKIVALNILTS